jgi:hypothetical protein
MLISSILTVKFTSNKKFSKGKQAMKKILIYAAPFSYGPTGKALSLASHLKDYYDIDLAGYDTSLELLALDDINISDSEQNEPLLRDRLDDEKLLTYSLVISCSDLNLALRAKKLGIKSVMLDSVFWWRSPTIEDITSVDAYIVQDFLGVDQAIDTLPKKPSNLHKVGAILRKNINEIKKDSNKTERIVINYGGIESPYVKVPENSNYPFIITKILSSLFETKSDTEFIVTGKFNVMKVLANEYNSYHNVKFETLDHNSFLNCIGSSNMVITTPGIETFYETIYFEKPSVLLLPHNSTQYLQLLALIEAGIENPVCHYNYYSLDNKYQRHIDESKEVKAVIDSFNCLTSSHKSLSDYQQNLYELVDNRLTVKDAYELKKDEYLAKIGVDGSQSIVKIIDILLN